MDKKYLDALKGISYREWKMLKLAIDRVFEHKKGEFENDIKLANTQDVENTILAQFGQILD